MTEQISAEKLEFNPLKETDFPLLATWMNRPHMKSWWAEGKSWSQEDIAQKYKTYIEGYKIKEGLKKPIHAFIISLDQKPIGYVQYYDAHDFERKYGYIKAIVPDLPDDSAALDFYIGEPDFIGKGLGVKILDVFIKKHIWPRFQACFVDPDTENESAIKMYTKAGFKTIEQNTFATLMMLKKT